MAGSPATVMTFPLVPVRSSASVAVKLYVTPAPVLVVNVIVARPLAFVVLVPPFENDPPVPLLVHVTVTPDVATGVFVPSTSCAVTVTGAPAATLGALAMTMYFVPRGAAVVIVAELPVIELVVAVTTCAVFGVVLVVNETVARPLALVVLVCDVNVPPLVLVQVTL